MTVTAAMRTARRLLRGELRMDRLAFWAAAALISLAIVYPASMSVYAAFTESGSFSLGGFARILEHPTVGREIVTTILFATGATFGAAVIGVPLAWVNARTDVPARRLLEILCVIPLFISAFVGAMAWRMLLVPRAGMFTRLMTDWGWPPELLPDVYSLTSMIVIQSIFYSPFMYLYAVASLRQMDPSLEEIARIHGASNWQVLWRVTLAVNGPALLSGMVLVFVFTVGTLEIPMALGAPGGNYVLATRIWSLMSDYPQDVTMAASLGILAILIAGTGIWIQRRLLGERQFTTVTGKGYRASRVRLGKWRWVAFGLVVSYVTIAVIAPLLVLVLVGLQKYWAGSFQVSLFTLDNFRSVLFEYDVTRRAIANSLLACSVAATVAVLLSAVLSQTRSRSGESFMGLLCLLPIAIPGAIFGMMVLFAFVRTPIYNTLAIIIFAYVIGYFYLSYRTIYSVRMSIHDELEQSARIHGATWWQSTRRILLPLLKPGVFSAWLMMFVVLVREFSSVMFLYRNGTEVMSVVFFLLMERHSARLAAFMIIQTVILLIVMAIFQRVSYRNSDTIAV
ncbi:MAG: iron ABC transporter permease [Rhodobacteraceae bacterium]|nr:iron ABC transporter permease [Paracoccaceae bacterium]MCY4138692.1 iron ABC transporter permease [Paracoccaceae bacterium]